MRYGWIVVGLVCLSGCPIYTESDYEETSVEVPDAGQECPEIKPARDACEGTGITNLLLGSCYWEQCRKGEKSLYPKIAGVNCVFQPEGSSEMIIGYCNDSGQCGKW